MRFHWAVIKFTTGVLQFQLSISVSHINVTSCLMTSIFRAILYERSLLSKQNSVTKMEGYDLPQLFIFYAK